MKKGDTLLRMIGLLGVLLPFVLLFGSYLSSSTPMRPSISAYYHTDMGYLFVGIMLATGAFLISYQSDSNKSWAKWLRRAHVRDDGFTSFSGSLAILVAVFPSSYKETIPDWVSNTHLIAAALFLLTTAYMSFARFAEQGENKALHRLCAGIILVMVCTLIIGVPLGWQLFPNWVWWLETLAVTSFGFSWLVKSGLIQGNEATRIAFGGLLVLGVAALLVQLRVE